MNKKGLKILDIPFSERPREKLLLEGPSKLSNSELLAIVLRTGNKNENVIALSSRVITKLGGIDGILDISLNEVLEIKGIKEAKASQILAIGELYKRIKTIKSSNKRIKITSPKVVFDVLENKMSSLNQEILMLIVLNTKNEILKTTEVFKGGLNSSLIHPREIFNEAIKNCAASIIICHNHPSGDPTPSGEDIAVTKRISECGKILGINLLDHIIIGNNKFISLKEKGII